MLFRSSSSADDEAAASSREGLRLVLEIDGEFENECVRYALPVGVLAHEDRLAVCVLLDDNGVHRADLLGFGLESVEVLSDGDLERLISLD